MTKGSCVLLALAALGGGLRANDPAWPAATLADTGLVVLRSPLALREGFVEFSVTEAPWLPGVSVRRWISLPPGARLHVNEEGEFEYPAGTVVVQHHAIQATGADFETHVFEFKGGNPAARKARAAAYRWSAVDDAAGLVQESRVIPLPGDPKRRWLSPGPEAATILDEAVAGFILPLSPRQLDERQWQAWGERGWLEPAVAGKTFPRMAALDEPTAPLDLRVRSFLDANCAVCHRPGGPGRGLFDARFSVPLADQRLINIGVEAGDLGVAGARLVVPGHPERSVLLLRMMRTDAVRMPPIGLADEPPPGMDVFASWINLLGGR